MVDLTQIAHQTLLGRKSVGDYMRQNDLYRQAEEEWALKKQQAEQQKQLNEMKIKQTQAEIDAGFSPTLPAALQVASALGKAREGVANAKTPQERALAEQRLNDIVMSGKLLDKGIMYGTGGFNPQGQMPQGMGQQGVDASQVSQYIPQMQLQEIGGYSDILAGREGKKEEAKLQQKLEYEPEIEAQKKNAVYMEEGRQKLPLIERSLKSQELREEYLMPKAQDIMGRISGMTAGFGGALIGSIPGTPAFDLKQDIQTLVANAGFDRLQEMRDNSPTGGALGQVSERELALLQSAAQNLLNSQSPEQLRENLRLFMEQRSRSLQNVQEAYIQDYQRFGGQMDANLPAPRFGVGVLETNDGQRQSPKKGDVVDGYMFNGGDPSEQKNWKKVR